MKLVEELDYLLPEMLQRTGDDSEEQESKAASLNRAVSSDKASVDWNRFVISEKKQRLPSSVVSSHNERRREKVRACSTGLWVSLQFSFPGSFLKSVFVKANRSLVKPDTHQHKERAFIKGCVCLYVHIHGYCGCTGVGGKVRTDRLQTRVVHFEAAVSSSGGARRSADAFLITSVFNI